MKRNILLAIAVLFALSIGAAVYAYNSTTITNASAPSCCCKGDSCPMKSKDAVKTAATADHKNCDCCGDSCPMMKDGKMAADGDHSCPMMKAGAEHKMDGKMAAEGDHSCPMMKDGKAHDMKDMKGMDPKTHDMHKNMAASADGKSGCTCACCAHNKEKKDAPAI